MDSRHRKKTKTNVWLAIGVALADLWGDTDVAAQIASLASTLKLMTV